MGGIEKAGNFGGDVVTPLPLAGGAGGGCAVVRLPAPLRLASKLASLAAPPASGWGGFA